MARLFKGPEGQFQALNTLTKMVRALNAVGSRLEPNLKEAGLTDTQFGAMEALYHVGPMGPKELGKKILRSGANMTTVVDQLEKAGWAKRHDNPDDRRCQLVKLTPAGTKKIAELFPRHAAAAQEAFAPLSKQELKELGRISKKLGLALRQGETP